MKKIIELVLVYLIGVLFLVTLAFRVGEIESDSVSNTSVASNYTIDLTNYESQRQQDEPLYQAGAAL